MTSESKRKKKTKIRVRSSTDGGFDPLVYHIETERARLGIRKLPTKETSMGRIEDAQGQIALADNLLLESKKRDIRRRRKLFAALARFEELLKAQLGGRISVRFRLDDFDQINVLTYFRPRKSKGTVIEHPFAGDPIVDAAAKKSGLYRYMDLVGTGTLLEPLIRDNHFVEKQWFPGQGERVPGLSISKKAAKKAMAKRR